MAVGATCQPTRVETPSDACSATPAVPGHVAEAAEAGAAVVAVGEVFVALVEDPLA